LPGQNCFAPLKQKLGLQSKEKRRHPPSAESACLLEAGILLRKTAEPFVVVKVCGGKASRIPGGMRQHTTWFSRLCGKMQAVLLACKCP